MESSVEGWRELRIPARAGKATCPKLFYNFRAHDAKLDLHVTDLVEIWAYILDSDEIEQEARKQKSSVDPSESPSQRKVLIQKLQQALAAGNNQLIREPDSKRHVLQLRTFLDLPKPLKPLEWTFKLLPQEASSMAEQILQPCLREASTSKQKLDSLQEIIKAKDRVISRLVERIESSGTDFSLIFPGITGLKSRKGTVSVKEAKKHVNGLAEFKESDWLSHFRSKSSGTEDDHSGLENLIAGHEACPKHTVADHQSWFKDLPKTFEEARSPSVIKKEQNAASIHRSEDEGRDEEEEATASEEDEFERQATPPGLKGSRPSTTDHEMVDKSPSKGDTAGNTTSNSTPAKSGKPSEHDRMSRASSETSTATETASESEGIKPAQPTRTSKLGRLKRKELSPLQENETELPSSQRSHPSDSGLDKGAPSRRLGRLGGAKSNGKRSPSGKEARSTPDQDMRSDEVENSDHEGNPLSEGDSQPATPQARRLGRLGGAKKSSGDGKGVATGPPKKASRSPSHDEEMETSPPAAAAKATSSTPEPNETAEQKADRRRKELKRTIAAPPVRKKRKF